MFLDLKSSTALAEKLSHVLYSKLIQDCFYELSIPVLDNKGEVYQYVGDEAVITWTKKEGLENTNCLNFYYDFMDRLENKRAYFLKSYKVFPEFKAGINLGRVSVAEVGVLKTEIAYHGDVLNTSARIEGFCNTFNKALLASEPLVLELGKSERYQSELIGEVQLRGKEGSHKLYSYERHPACITPLQ
ncbi:adenylate/guanylate cyclase domain-containing protein [Carboxylicivirga sp. RSCT41]|uniref:adenylate/guanylate cyclase domain-containing protein n=1 Tax=Carboxylicivirga agarovorans TaxID=3417570 RepID=UPI003D3443EE